MAVIISVVNQKGGVGKTTTAVNLAACLSCAGQETLLVDVDPQGNATSGIGFNPADLERTVYDALLGEVQPSEVVQKTSIDRLSLMPANMDLSGAEIELMGREDRLECLRNILRSVEQSFDYIIIDSPPSLSILALNVLGATQLAVTPVQCEYYALEGLTSLLQTFDKVRETINPDLSMLGILMTMFDQRTNLSKQVMEDVRGAFGEQVFENYIPRSVKLSEAPSFGKPVMHYDNASKGSEAYLKFSQEVLHRVEKGRTWKGFGRLAGETGQSAGPANEDPEDRSGVE